MSSEADEQFEDCATALLEFFGRSVTRYPLGQTSGGVAVTAIWEETRSSEERETGLANQRTGYLKVLTTVTADDRDTYSIDGEVWGVEAIGINGAFRVLKLIYVQHDRVSRIEQA